jgi:hypothetical protein
MQITHVNNEELLPVQGPIFHHPIRSPGPHTWQLHGPKGMAVSIDLDTGEYKFGEAYTIDEAAGVFWEAVARNLRETG